MLTSIVLFIICLLLIVFFIYRAYLIRKKSHIKNNILTDNSGVIGMSNKQKNNDEKKLTLKERVELSWEFLYKITELIVNRFSQEDIVLVNKLGQSLLNNGMKYEHSVDNNIRETKSQVKNIEQQSQNLDTNKTRRI